jgi:hypothetical protein
MNKTCFKCKKEKPIDEFYRHPQMKDGHLNKCKECGKKDTVTWRLANLERARAMALEFSKKPRYVQARAVNTVRWRQENPRKYAAHVLLGNAIRAGKVKRLPCQECGKKSHGHHEDYDNPLEVTWLCAAHHRQRHEQMKREGITP